MKFNYKSRKGFTLIELLVVIGILAVLAAIAIPSVAGLIDRANVSADETNANETTNAIERFASEYELYVQDIGSGALNPNDLDSAQGRVYNVTGATTRGDITAIEKAQSVKVADVGDEVAIYRDTKYPVNNATLHKIVENYMKTSSSTFEPKQSDCNYYYSPDCGIVVCTETDKAEITDLNALIVSGKDAKGKELGSQTQWINITEGTTDNNNSVDENNNSQNKTIAAVFSDGESFTWEELLLNENKSKYGYELDVYGTNVSGSFFDVELTKIVIPEGITCIADCTFDGCFSLTDITIPSTINRIEDGAIDSSISKINFGGTISQLSNISFFDEHSFMNTLFICSNGNAKKCNTCLVFNNILNESCNNCQNCTSHDICTHPNVCKHEWCYHNGISVDDPTTCSICGFYGYLDVKACKKCLKDVEYGWHCDVCGANDIGGDMPNTCKKCGREVE